VWRENRTVDELNTSPRTTSVKLMLRPVSMGRVQGKEGREKDRKVPREEKRGKDDVSGGVGRSGNTDQSVGGSWWRVLRCEEKGRELARGDKDVKKVVGPVSVGRLQHPRAKHALCK